MTISMLTLSKISGESNYFSVPVDFTARYSDAVIKKALYRKLVLEAKDKNYDATCLSIISESIVNDTLSFEFVCSYTKSDFNPSDCYSDLIYLVTDSAAPPIDKFDRFVIRLRFDSRNKIVSVELDDFYCVTSGIFEQNVFNIAFKDDYEFDLFIAYSSYETMKEAGAFDGETFEKFLMCDQFEEYSAYCNLLEY